MGILDKIFGTYSEREVKRIIPTVNKIDSLDESMQKLTDEELRAKTDEFKKRLSDGETLNDILPEAFAVVREASSRTIGLKHFREQLIGGIVLHQGRIAEMKTGEGKTLTSTLVAYLNALDGNGVHIVTVNEYLASRDAEEMGALHKWLGLTVGLNLRDMTPEEKRAQYNCDITYSTNNELGFDYLRDHMVLYKEDMVQRPLNFAIIDEVDSILIDEARTPLIISGGAKKGPNLYLQANTLVKNFSEEDYEIDIEAKHVTLTESGMLKAERYFGIDNLYDVKNVQLLHHINNALRANFIMARDVDYVVNDGKVIIVDPFTGRLMHGRQYSEGLHQALEAKENVEIKKETRTLATITFQNYFRMYKKLAGMTGTAKTEEEEFRNIYNMYVVEVPTNVPVIRQDDPDLMFRTMDAKYKAIVKDIKARYEKGQPVLVGTISIETSELISKLLTRAGVRHNVLNAKNHGKEAEIIKHAGEKHAVTIATNMAGRGTDIKLGEGVRELGGLAVIGTERHEARRIDNQLRGRSGRQGDPGYSRFYLSAEDELLVRFGSERFKNALSMVITHDEAGDEVPLESKMFSRFVEAAQRKIEGNNFDRRKTVVEYDEVLRKQRDIIYKQRNDILFLDDIEPVVLKMFNSVSQRKAFANIEHEGKGKVTVNAKNLLNDIYSQLFNLNEFTLEDFEGKTPEEASAILEERLIENLNEKKELVPKEVYDEFLKVVLLRVVDEHWMDHIDQMSELRQGIGLQAYAQVNPLRQYQEIGFEMFEAMIEGIEEQSVSLINRAQIRDNLQREAVAKISGTSDGKEETRKRAPVKVGTKVGRNDPCPCGSGLKYKHCCGK